MYLGEIVPGLGREADGIQVKYMIGKDDTYQFCVFDNRGVGRSSVPEGRYK